MMWKLFLTSLALLGLTSCAAAKEYVPDFELGLSLGEAGAQYGVTAAIESKSMSKCLAWDFTRELAKAGIDYLEKVDQTGSWAPGIPDFHIQYDACAPLKNSDGTWRPVIKSTSEPLVNGILLPFVKPLADRVSKWISDSGMECHAKEVLSKLVKWLGTAGPLAVAELENPDGMADVPGVTFDFKDCQ